jgi:hypothetical protein
LINLAAKYITAQFGQDLPDAWFGFDTPPPSKQDGYWIRTDANGFFMGVYVYVNGEWQTIQSTSGAYVKLSYTLASGTNGAAPAQQVWTTYPINTEDTDTNNLCTLASNQITLVAGTYRIDAEAIGIRNHSWRLRLRNTTDNSTVLLGTSGYSTTENEQATTSRVVGQFTSNGTDLYEIQYFSKESRDKGLGIGEASAMESEVYMIAQFWST